MSYYQKYLKYKEKYLQLKKTGGYHCPADHHAATEEELVENKDNECCVCFINFSNIKIYGCCHRICGGCVARLKPDICPQCRTQFESVFVLNDARTYWMKIRHTPGSVPRLGFFFQHPPGHTFPPAAWPVGVRFGVPQPPK